MLAVAGLAAGCPRKKEDGNGEPAPKVKLARLDLSSAGLPLTIEAPEGATAEKVEITDSVTVKKGDTFELSISGKAADIAEQRKFAKENTVVKLERFFVDTADTLFYEGQMAGTKQYHFLTNVKVDDKVYSVKPGAVPFTHKGWMDVMLKCARTLAAKPKAPAEAPGPKDVALAIWKAMEKGDGEAVAARYDCPEPDKAFLKQTMTITGKMTAFANAGIKAYGKDAWIAAAKKAEMEHLAQPSIPALAGAEQKIQCKIEGDKATCTLEGIEEPVVLVKKDGTWRGLPGKFPPKAERDGILKPMSAMGKAMDAVMGRIGQAGVTADKVFEEFTQAMLKAMGGEAP